MTTGTRHNIYDDLTIEGRKKLMVGQVLTFANGKSYRVVRKSKPKREFIVEETKLLTEDEFEQTLPPES